MTFIIRQERQEDDFACNKIIQKAFGPGRYAKSAYRFRDGLADIEELAYVAENHLKQIVGTIRYWHFSQADKILLLGPIAVESDLRNMGLGENLMFVSLEKAKNLGYTQVILIGHPAYYQRFGFSYAGRENIQFPYPIDNNRFLGLFL